MLAGACYPDGHTILSDKDKRIAFDGFKVLIQTELGSEGVVKISFK